MTFDNWVQPRLQADAVEAAGVLRLALAEADSDPRTLRLTARTIIAARGSLAGLNLSREEILALAGLKEDQSVWPR